MNAPAPSAPALQGRRFLVTAGPTIEAIDPVRFISNHSTGKMGYAIAAELAARGADVVLVSGPTALDPPAGVKRVDVVSAGDMYRETTALWPSMNGAVMCAAVADYTPAEVSDVKIKKASLPRAGAQDDASDAAAEHLTLVLKPTKDIAAELGRTKRPGQLLVGFALETDNEERNAVDKLERKNLDFIVLNSLRRQGAGFGGDTNRITIFERCDGTSSGRTDTFQPLSHPPLSLPARTDFPLELKRDAARRIVDRIAEAFGKR